MLSFYDIDLNYINFLKTIDKRIPNISYSNRDKFVCGIILQMNNHDYYAPISSKHVAQDTNFIIFDNNNKAVSSIRFCFMFPAISSVLHKISIKKYLHSKNKQNRSYGALMYSEHNYCKRFEQNIRKKALRIYNSRLDKKMPNFSFYELHCCDFPLLEANYMNYNPNIQYSTI